MAVSVRVVLIWCVVSSVGSQGFSWQPPPEHSVQSAFERFQSLGLTKDFPSGSGQQPSRYDANPQSRPVPKTKEAQEKQSFDKPLTWRFPVVVEEEGPGYPPEFKLEQPVPPASVSIQCGSASIRVEVKKDLFGLGRPVQPADILLGHCPISGEDPEAQVWVVEAQLHECGSQLMTSDDSLVYVFTLHYNASPLGGSPIVRTRDSTISLECHYRKNNGVSSDGILPTWVPHDESQDSMGSMYISLKLMTDDWRFERPSSQFLLGDMLRFEASVQQFYHTPLRVFVDNCVATLSPNPDTVPRYGFLGNRGCLIDGKLTNSDSRFLPRIQDDTLQFQLEAFRFQEDDVGLIYITCNLRVATVNTPISTTNKACSYSNRWTEASGRDPSCACCDTDCGAAPQPYAPADAVDEWEHETTVGPIGVMERPL